MKTTLGSWLREHYRTTIFKKANTCQEKPLNSLKIQLRNKCLIASATCQVPPRSRVTYEDTVVPRERLGWTFLVQVPHGPGLRPMLTLCYLDSPTPSHSLLCLAPPSSALTTDPELAHSLLNSPRPLPMLGYLTAYEDLGVFFLICMKSSTGCWQL